MVQRVLMCTVNRATERAPPSNVSPRRGGKGKKTREKKRGEPDAPEAHAEDYTLPRIGMRGHRARRYAPPLSSFTYARLSGDSAFVFTTVSHSRRLSSIDATLSPLRSSRLAQKAPAGLSIALFDCWAGSGWLADRPRARAAQRAGGGRAIPRNGHDVGIDPESIRYRGAPSSHSGR